jgi:UPF0716 protein FxsA
VRLLFFVLVFCELWLGILATENFGFFNTFLIYFVPTFLGLPVFAFQNQLNWMQFQRHLALGRTPDREMLNLVSRFIGSVLLLVPSILCRVMALILLLPPTRFIFILFSRVWLARKIAEGSFRVFSGGQGFGFGGSGFRYYSASDLRAQPDERVERDAKVIDVEALKIPDNENKKD